jgi:hypothetical protein
VLDERWVVVGALIGIAGQTSYFRDTLTGRVQPNRVTFLMWALAPLLAFAVEVQAGGGLRSLMTFIVGFGPLMIFAASFAHRGSAWLLTRFDVICGVLSLVGLAAWLVTREGRYALVLAISADFLAGMPTGRKVWRAPETESLPLYVCATVNAVIALLTIDHWTLEEAAFPAYIAVFGCLLSVLLLVRRGSTVTAVRPQADTARH